MSKNFVTDILPLYSGWGVCLMTDTTYSLFSLRPRKKIQSPGTPNLRMRCHIKLGRATLSISGDTNPHVISRKQNTALASDFFP